MMKKLLLCLLAITIAIWSIPAFAEDFNVEQYSYEELKSIQEQVNQKIAEMERQYAIEHGDRKISFEHDEVTLYTGKYYKVNPIVTRVVETAPKSTTFLFTTSDAAIAKVSTDGRVNGISAGEAVITVTAKDNDCIFSSFTVKVVTPVKTVKAVEKEITLFLAGTEQPQETLQFTIAPEGARYDSVTWKSSQPTVVTVDENGKITGLKSGQATVTATIQCAGASENPKKISYTIRVVQPVSSITLSESNLIMNKGSSKTLKATVLPETATNKAVKWSSSDTKIATVSSSGYVSAKACGTCVITCTAADGSNVLATCNVTVKQLITQLSFNTKKITLGLKESKQVTPTIYPKDASEKKLTWTSSNPNVASVSSNGTVKGIKGGDCVITCTATDGSNKTASYNVHIPTFSFTSNSYTVYSKNGSDISINLSGISAYNLTVTSSSYYFDAYISGSKLHISPIKAGTGTVTVKYKDDTAKLTITIDHSAVYDSYSYPKASYSDILRYPSSYKGNKIHIYGKVLQKTSYGSKTYLRVGTSGYGYYDSVFWVEYSSNLGVSIIEDDYITVYGSCTGTYTYKAVLGQSITIPSMTAEKINIGRWN